MEPVAWTAVAMAAVSNMATWLVIIKNKNGMKNYRTTKPGSGEICREHGEKIARVETESNNTKDDIKEIKRAIEAIRQVVVR